jgi:hypothetical protein
MLRAAEADLADRLEEACAMRQDVSGETTAELMRLEETLLEAARAAKQAVSVRRRRRSLGGVTGDGPRSVGLSTASAPPADEAFSVRDFVDAQRVEWRVWEVIPSQPHDTAHGSAHGTTNPLGDYQSGWLAFEAIASGQRRRLRDYPRDWNKLSNDELESLLARAEAARPPRRQSGQSDERRS